MGVAEGWLGTLALAGVPAFVCQRDGDAVEILTRTPKFVAVRDSLSAFDEAALLHRVAAHWRTAGRGPIIVETDGETAWRCVLRTFDETPHRCLAILRVLSPRQRYHETFLSIVENMPDIVSRYDRNFRHLYVNSAIEKVTPELKAQDYIGKDHYELGLPTHLAQQWQSAYDRAFTDGETIEQQFEFPGPDGPRHFLFRTVPEYGPDGEVHTVLNTARDITELKSLQHQLELLAHTDPLTSLLNRRGFVNCADAELLRVRQGHGTLSLMLLDIDDFKSVNDTYGHIAGDNVLIAISEVLQQEAGERDFVARLGGDEFCVGIVDADETEPQSRVDRIRLRINELGAEDHCPCQVSVSIGLAGVDEYDHDISELLTRVDQLMYREKPRRR